jgi:hypothetical protein
LCLAEIHKIGGAFLNYDEAGGVFYGTKPEVETSFADLIERSQMPETGNIFQRDAICVSSLRPPRETANKELVSVDDDPWPSDSA